MQRPVAGAGLRVAREFSKVAAGGGGGGNVSKAATANAAAMAGPRAARIFLASPGVVADPVVLPDPMPSVMSVDGVKSYFQAVRSSLGNMLSLRKIRKAGLEFESGAFLDEAVEIYTRMNSAFSLANRSALREVVTEPLFAEFKRSLKDRKSGERHVWRLDRVDLRRIETVRWFQVNENQFEYAQVAVRLRTHQSLAVFNPKGRLIAGRPGESVPVHEICVFERSLKGDNGAWRYCGKIATGDAEKKTAMEE